MSEVINEYQRGTHVEIVRDYFDEAAKLYEEMSYEDIIEALGRLDIISDELADLYLDIPDWNYDYQMTIINLIYGGRLLIGLADEIERGVI